MTKDCCRVEPVEAKISCKPAQNFVMRSRLNLPHFLYPQNHSAVFFGRASTFIICCSTNLLLCFAYLPA